MAQRQLQGFLGPGCERRADRSGSAAGAPSSPRQSSTAGTGSSFPKRDLDGVAALEPEFGSLQGPDRRGGRAGAQRETVGLGLQRQRGRALGPSRPQATAG